MSTGMTVAINQGRAMVEALNRFNGIVTQYCESQMFFAACRLGIFEQLAAGSATAEQLADRIKVHPDPCVRLLMGLEHLGLVERHGQLFSNTAVARYATS